MEEVLDLYAEPSDPSRPVVCFDESPVQLIGEVRQVRQSRAGSIVTTTNIVALDGQSHCSPRAASSRRKVKLAKRQPAKDYAQCMRDLVDIPSPAAEIIRVVRNTLSTHSAGALYQRFSPAEARPSHGESSSTIPPSTLENEIGVLRGQCHARRIDEPKRLHREISRL